MISWIVGAVLTTLGCILLRTPICVIFQLAAAFSEASAIGVICNRRGGWKACVVAGLFAGFLATASAAFFASGMGILDEGIAQVNFDSNAYPALVTYIFRLFVK